MAIEMKPQRLGPNTDSELQLPFHNPTTQAVKPKRSSTSSSSKRSSASGSSTPSHITSASPALSEKTPEISKKFTTATTATTASFDVSVTLLTTLKEIAQASGMIPYVGLAAALALEIVSAAQATKDNKDGFRRLACDACSLVTNIATVCVQLIGSQRTFDSESEGREEREGERLEQGLSPMLNDHLRTLKDTLTQIKEFAESRSHKAYWKRYLSARSDKDRIQEFRDRLRQALDVFGVQSHITVRESVVRMANRQETFHEDLKENLIPSWREKREWSCSASDGAEVECESPSEETLSSSSERRRSGSRNPFVSASAIPSSTSTSSSSSSSSSPSTPTSPTPTAVPSPSNSFDNAFKDVFSSATFSGTVTINNISGDNHTTTDNSKRVCRNVGNVVNRTLVNSNNTFI